MTFTRYAAIERNSSLLPSHLERNSLRLPVLTELEGPASTEGFGGFGKADAWNKEVSRQRHSTASPSTAK